MPFPPNFDNVWDITQPPDTQLANLLGQDIRNLKDDIMQRMSLLSGLLANRPSPEVLNATWGGAGFGLIYIATDTSQIFQWNGAAWVPISFGGTSIKLVDGSLYTRNSGTGDFATVGVTIPGGTLIVGSVVRVVTWGINQSNGVPQVFYEVNGATLPNGDAPGPTLLQGYRYTLDILITGQANNAQFVSTFDTVGNNTDARPGSFNLNLANPIVINTLLRPSTSGINQNGLFALVNP